jgi:hypothetical protein
VATVLQRALVIVKRPRHTQGFQVVQWRWNVERTFGGSIARGSSVKTLRPCLRPRRRGSELP